MNKRLFFIGLSCLTACAVGPDYKRPDFASDGDIAKALSLNGSAALVLRPDWYAAFDDPVLTGLVETAMAENPTIEEGLHKLRRARRLLSAAEAGALPSFDVSAGYTKVKPSRNVAASVREDYYTAGVDASWEIDLWGADRRRVEAAGAAVLSAEATLDGLRSMIKAEVVAVYVKLRSAQRRLRLLRQTEDMQESLTKIAEARRMSGLSAQTDALPVRIAAETMKAKIPPLEQSVDAYKNALAVLTGRLPDDPDFLAENGNGGNIVERTFLCDLSALYGIPASVIRRRPDVRAAEAALISANAEIGQAVAALYPNVSLSALLGFQSDAFSRLTSPNSHLVNLTPAVSLPLFHWNALTNAVEAAKESEAAQKAAYKNAVLSAVRDLKDAMTRVDKSYAAYLRNERAAVKTRSLTAERLKLHSSGLVPLSDALTSVQDLLDAKSTETESKAAVYQAVAAFYKAAGV